MAFGLVRAGGARIVRDAADLDACLDGDELGLILHIEGAEAIGEDLEELELWYAAGLRSLGPLWSRPNRFGSGVQFKFPSSPDTGPGLTRAGRRLVRRCAELGIAVDLSHLTEGGFWDAAHELEGPLIASHSCAHALVPASRNLTDAQIRAIAPTGGLVGINYEVSMIRPDARRDADTPLSRIAEHVSAHRRPRRRRARRARLRLGRGDDARGDRDGTRPPGADRDARAGRLQQRRARADRARELAQGPLRGVAIESARCE